MQGLFYKGAPITEVIDALNKQVKGEELTELIEALQSIQADREQDAENIYWNASYDGEDIIFEKYLVEKDVMHFRVVQKILTTDENGQPDKLGKTEQIYKNKKPFMFKTKLIALRHLLKLRKTKKQQLESSIVTIDKHISKIEQMIEEER